MCLLQGMKDSLVSTEINIACVQASKVRLGVKGSVGTHIYSSVGQTLRVCMCECHIYQRLQPSYKPHCQDECVREPWTFRSIAHAGRHRENIKIVIQAQNNVRSSYKEAEWSRCVSFLLVLKKDLVHHSCLTCTTKAPRNSGAVLCASMTFHQ